MQWNAGDCNNLRINKVSIIGTNLDFMKKDFDHFRGYEKYGLWKNWSIFKGGSKCENP